MTTPEAAYALACPLAAVTAQAHAYLPAARAPHPL